MIALSFKDFDRDNGYELFCRLKNFYSERNILFLGENCDLSHNESILKLSWNTVFTSIRDKDKIDKICSCLETSRRKVTLIKKIDALNSLSRLSNTNSITDIYDLKVIQLFDDDTSDETLSIRQIKPAKKIIENYAANLLKNYGSMFIIGYNDNDILKPDQLIESIFEVGEARSDNECVYFFDVNDETSNISDLCSDEDFIVMSKQSLTDIWSEYLNEEDEDFRTEEQETPGSGKNIMFFVDGNTVFIPEKEEKEILPFAELLEFTKLNPAPKEKYRYRLWFAAFLKHDMDLPKWYGYREGFVLKRKFQEDLINIVRKTLERPGEMEYRPILLHGQSGSGKTIAMGLLAYTIFHEKQFPVVYITDPNISFFNDENNTNRNFEKLKNFLQYIQNCKKAKSILLIWDCSGLDKERNDYLHLKVRLRNLGINVVLVGTSYQLTENYLKKNSDFKSFYDIETSVELSDEDIKNLDILLKRKAKMDESERNFIIEHLRQDLKYNASYGGNFLAMLYYVFWDIRDDLSNGIQREFLQTLSELKNFSSDNKEGFYSSYAIKNYEKYQQLVHKLFDASDVEKSIDDFTKFTAFFTYYNKEISLDLSYSLLGTNLDVLRKVLDAPIFSIQTYSNRITYKIRTRFEAKLLLRAYHIDIENDYRQIAQYICRILYAIEQGNFNSISEPEIIETVTRIISIIGPNSNSANDTKWNDSDFNYYAPCIIYSLFLAGNAVGYDPRLVVQELSLSREYYKYKKNNPSFLPLTYEEYIAFFADFRDDVYEYDEENLDDSKLSDYFSAKNYEPDLLDKINRGKQFCNDQENYELEYRIYFEQIKIDIANGLIVLGTKDSVLEAAKMCRGIVNASMDPHSVTTWMKAYNAVLELEEKDNLQLIEKMMSFAVDAIQFNPSLTEDGYFVTEYFKLFMHINENILKKNLQEIAEEMHLSQPTSALIFCWAYSQLFDRYIIRQKDQSIMWESVTKDSLEYRLVSDILNTMEKYDDVIQNDSKCLYLRMQLFWLLNNGEPLNFKNEKQCTRLSNDNWKIIEDFCDKIINASLMDDHMFVYHCQYIKSIAMLQLENYSAARKQLAEIKDKLNYMKVYTKHLICNEGGSPKEFSGKIISLSDDGKSGGKLDLYTPKGICIKNVYFNRFNMAANTAKVLEPRTSIDKLMMGVGFMGINALRWQDEKECKNG